MRSFTVNFRFVEYWEDYFKCRYPNSSETPFNQNYTEPCNMSLRQTKDNGYEAEAQLQFVSDSVMAFAVALKVSTVFHSGNAHTCIIASFAFCNVCLASHLQFI